MRFLAEWFLAWHRAVWFPLLYLTGLEGKAEDLPGFPMSTNDTRNGVEVDPQVPFPGLRGFQWE